MSKKKSKKEVVSMKEAFNKASFGQKTKKISKRENGGIREFFWNYPDTISKLIHLTAPLSMIILFSLIGVGIFFLLRSESFAQQVSIRRSNYFVEGRIGAISTFNPLFSNQNDVDKAIQELVFEKFVYIDKDGNLLPGIAKDWSIDDDGMVYNFEITLEHTWSDGTPLTIDDIYFTFDTAIKLSEDHGYDTVASALSEVEIEIVDETNIRFLLPEKNALFGEMASVYIVPKHILEDINLAEMPFNIFSRNPIGSGPYRIYKSEPNIVYLQASAYHEPIANIQNLVIRIYSELEKLEAAFRNGLLDGAILSKNSETIFVEEYSTYETHRIDLPYRQRKIFFNLRKDKFENQDLRKGIAQLVDTQEILDLAGIDAILSNGPIYENSWAYNEDANYITYNQEEAIKTLEGVGYTRNDTNGYLEAEDGKLLTFTISYLDNDINNRLMSALEQSLLEEGVIVTLEPLSYSRLTQEIIATRNFEVLLYEIELSVDPDQYNLWHSLQKEYPNLNLSGFEYERVDILLEEGRRKLDLEERKNDYVLFQRYLIDQVPAIFLYRPSYIYVVRQGIEGINYEDIVRLEDIYKDIYSWEFYK